MYLTSEALGDYLRTRSDHRMMTAETREAIVAGLQSALAKQGGAFDWPFQTHLYMAHRRD